MVERFRSSERLQRIRISGRCYTLLNQARIAPHNIENFHRTYRLPADPFFRLFFTIKRDYLVERERRKEDRRQYILNTMRSLPPDTLSRIRYLGYLERHMSAAGRSPLWQTEIFPGTKKKADSYVRYSPARWYALYHRHLLRLVQKYPRFTTESARRVHSCFVLGLLPDTIPPTRPPTSAVIRAYRRLSLLHHPDRGGDPETFISIKQARDVLIGGVRDDQPGRR